MEKFKIRNPKLKANPKGKFSFRDRSKKRATGKRRILPQRRRETLRNAEKKSLQKSPIMKTRIRRYFDRSNQFGKKAASGCRTPRPRGGNGVGESATTSWSAAAPCRFLSLRDPLR